MMIRRAGWMLLLLLVVAGCGRSPADSGDGSGDGTRGLSDSAPGVISGEGDVEIALYRLMAPGGAYAIEQASGAHFGKVGPREGLWIVSDRNGGRSAGRLFFISAETLRKANAGGEVEADEAFAVVSPPGQWSVFAEVNKAAGADALEELRERIGVDLAGGQRPKLDLEAVVTGPAIAGGVDRERVFVAAEEPHSVVLELDLEGKGEAAMARLRAVYRYVEALDEAGTDRNDGLEGLAVGPEKGQVYWAEEGTKFHEGPPGPRLFFVEPRLGLGTLKAGRVEVDRVVSDALTGAGRGQREGKMQTLNALTRTPDGRLLAVDRNGGWVLEVDTKATTARRWLNLHDLAGVNLREAMAEFPGKRGLPYISIEGIAMDPEGTLWMVDDPAMPEGFRASALISVRGLKAPEPEVGEGG